MSSVIKLLPPNLINQIAAGEVIERPAAVVKELVENSIDAGANVIKVILHNGGKSFMAIEDNGVGISKEDLALCLLPHSTSKLPTENLFEINTLGFRGEALASIASISKIKIASKYYSDNEAYEISAANGVMHDIKPTNLQQGTIITVRDLFFSIPARLKFLRNDSTEASNCFNVIKRLAIANPRVSFKVEHNDKVVINYLTANSSGELIEDKEVLSYRLQQVFGKDFIANSVHVAESNPLMTVHGFLGVPTYSHNHSNYQFIMLNGRSLKDKQLSYLIKLGYGDSLVKGRQPCYVLFIEIASKEVDINVNPTKSEVRFRDVNLVKHLLLNMVKGQILNKSLQTNDSNIAKQLLNKSYDKTMQQIELSVGNQSEKQLNLGSLQKSNLQDSAYNNLTPNKIDNWAINKNTLNSNTKAELQNYHALMQSETQIQEKQPYKDQALENNFIVAESPLEEFDNNLRSINNNVIIKEDNIKEDINISQDNRSDNSSEDPTNNSEIIQDYPLGFAKAQLHKNWIIAQNSEGLVVVDQHAAHERITHEQLKEQFYSQKILKQMLLLPEFLTLNPDEIAILNAYKNEVNSLGIIFDTAEDNVISIKEIPAIIGEVNVVTLMKELISDLIALDNIESFNQQINAILAKIACHGSIRSGKILSISEMNALLRSMEKTKSYAQCSHGRPTFIKISLKDLENLFGR